MDRVVYRLRFFFVDEVYFPWSFGWRLTWKLAAIHFSLLRLVSCQRFLFGGRQTWFVGRETQQTSAELRISTKAKDCWFLKGPLDWNLAGLSLVNLVMSFQLPHWSFSAALEEGAWLFVTGQELSPSLALGDGFWLMRIHKRIYGSWLVSK
jgi:hypothetical protein